MIKSKICQVCQIQAKTIYSCNIWDDNQWSIGRIVNTMYRSKCNANNTMNSKQFTECNSYKTIHKLQKYKAYIQRIDKKKTDRKKTVL